jgi:serine/threonine protein kinase
VAEPARRYELLQRIAAGGMGEVFRAQVSGEHGFKKPVAIKRILPEGARDAKLLLRLIAEAKTMVALSHANIVQVFDLCRANDELFIVMELVDGADLMMLLTAERRRRRQTPIPIALYLAMEALKALAYAHGATPGVIHCDISPSNLLISIAGEVKITDFGIAQSMQRAAHRGKVREVMGKLSYMSPERMKSGTVDALGDIYALGVVLWETLAVRPLFRRGQSEDDLAQAICHEVPPRLDAVREDLPPALATVVASALDKQPEKRPRSAAEMLQALAQVSHELGPPLTAPDVGAWVRDLRDAGAPSSAQPADRPETLPTVPIGARTETSPTQRASTSVDRPRTLTFRGEVGADGVLILTEEPATPPTWRRYAWIGATCAIAASIIAARVQTPARSAPAAIAPSVPQAPPPGPPASAPPASPQETVAVPRPPTPTPTPTPTVRAPRRLADAYGFLNVYSEPWAQVTVDGRDVGTTPILKLRLPTGEHRVRLKNPSRAPYDKHVRIVKDRVELVSIELGRD